MLSPEKTAVLTTFLGSLPENVSLRLAKAVEVDRLAGGTGLPHDIILEALRPALRAAHSAERTLTPLRLFCEPFEDLLTTVPSKEKRKGRIARGHVVPVWLWLSETLMPKETKSYVTAIRESILGYRMVEAKQQANAFWTAVSEAIRSALTNDRANTRRVLGSDLILADADEMALLLSAGGSIADLQEKLPRGTPSLNEDLIWALRGIYDNLVKTNPDAAPYVAVIAMARLERPWEALKLPLQISRQTSDTLIASTDMGLAGEVLLADLDIHAAAIRAVKHPNFDPADLALHGREFSKISTGLVQEVELRRDGPWHQRLMKDRTAVADTMEALMERAPREIIAALPVQKTGSYGGGPKAPDISRAPDADKSERGLRYAKLVVACRPFAAAASFGAAQKDAYNEVCVHLKTYCDDIVREVRSVDGPKRAIAEQYFALAAEFTAILFSEEEAELLRRRGRAAMAAAA